MKFKVRLLFILIIIPTFFCQKKSNPVNPVEHEFIYPISIGNSWDYKMTSYGVSIIPIIDTLESDTSYIIFDTLHADLNMVIDYMEEINDTVDTYVFKEFYQSNDTQEEYRSECYYKQDQSGLYEYGYKGGTNLIMPKTQNKYPLLEMFNPSFLDRYIGTNSGMLFQNDSLYLYVPPRMSLKYPLIYPLQWNYNIDWPIDKKVNGMVTIEVPAGIFRCYEIQWLFDIDRNGEWDDDFIRYDYISSCGLIKRIKIFYFESVVVQSDTLISVPDTLTVECVLTDYNLM